MAKQMAEGGGGTGDIDAEGVLRGTGTALGAAGQVAQLAGADPVARQMLGVAQQAATVAAAAYEAGEALVDAGRVIIEELSGEAEQHRVELVFECEAEAEAGWRIRELDLEEELDSPYRARLLLVTEHVDALPTHLLGQDCTVRIRRGPDAERTLHGIISRVEHGHRTQRHVTTTIDVVPALEALRHVKDSRIFQNLNTLEIIDAMLGPYLDQYARELRVEASGKYYAREYCVQYQESVLDFFHRLCEDEGLTYYFDQSGTHEVLVVVDENASFPAYAPDNPEVPFVVHRGGDIARAEPVYALSAADQLGPTSLTLADFDWTAGELPFSAEQRSRDVRDRDREQYEHGGTNVGNYDADKLGYTTRDLKSRVQRGRERQALTTFEYRGEGAVTRFRVGTVFTVADHPDASLNGEYLLVAVHHRGRDLHAGDAPSAGGSGGDLEYENEFVCVPSSVTYRPQVRTPKPRISGVQTAMVVGPENEEIWTDEHGRIRIQLHWDRVGRNDQDSTCWVRVMQSWAGAGFGTMFIPRIGMEVVLTFVDGDPDRPLVTGCVYNANNVPPMTLPDDKTQSIIRTKSSRNSDGFNELRFEDKSGSERVYLQAQKDLTEYVLHDHSTHVKHNQSNAVDADQTETVGHDQRLHVKGDRHKTIDGEENVRVVCSRHTVIETDSSDEIGGNYKETITGWRNVAVTEKDTELFEGGREVTVQEFDNLRVKGANKNTHVEDQYNISAGTHFKVMQGSETLLLKDEVFIESSSKAQVKSSAARLVLDGADARVLASGVITLEAGGCKIAIGNGKVAISAPAIELQGGGSEVKLDASGAVVAGTTTARLSAMAMVTIMGGIVAVN